MTTIDHADRVALGEPAAFSADHVATRALRVARRTALGVLGDSEAAADVAQDVAITAVRRAASLRDPAALDAWVHRIAVRAALREARRAGRRREAERAGHDPPPPAEHAAPAALRELDLRRIQGTDHRAAGHGDVGRSAERDAALGRRFRIDRQGLRR